MHGKRRVDRNRANLASVVQYILVGGSSETIALQPISVQAQEGLNFALGVAELELEATADCDSSSKNRTEP
jgi:hypothetical protein